MRSRCFFTLGEPPLPARCEQGGVGQSDDCAACGGIVYEYRVLDVGGRRVVLGNCAKARDLEVMLRAA